MTCIVGYTDGKTVWIGGDSAGVAGLSLSRRADRKVFKNGDFVFGFTSSFRMGQLLEHSFSPPKRHADTEVFAYTVKDFIPALRDCLKAGGMAEKRNEAESAGTFLVGYEGRLFQIADDYQVGESLESFDACGCGEDIALGAMFASNRDAAPWDRLLTALQAAELFSAGVRGPFNFVCTNDNATKGQQAAA